MASEPVEVRERGWRFKCGIALFILMVVLILLIPLAALSGMAPGRLAAATGTIFVVNKVLLIMVIAVMGTSGFQELKTTLASYIPSLKDERPVGPVRHAIGLLMFCIPLASAMIEPYVDQIWPGLRSHRWEMQLATDIMLAASIFVLGGNFWGKVRALFIRTARVVDTR